MNLKFNVGKKSKQFSPLSPSSEAVKTIYNSYFCILTKKRLSK